MTDDRVDTRATLRPSPDTVSRLMDGECVLVQLQTNRIYQLNRTGARLWELLEAGNDLGQAQAQLLGEFDVDAETLSREVDNLVGELVETGLLERDDDS